MSEVVSKFQELSATGQWVPLFSFILLGIIIGITIMNIMIEKKRLKKDLWFLLFSCGLIFFGLIWIITPNMLNEIGILATFVVALTTFRTLYEMEATRISQTRPHIIVDIDMKPARPLFDIRIKNIGNGVGYNFTSEWSPELLDAKGHNHSEMKLFKMIEYFPPDKEIVTLFESTISFFQKKPPLPRIYAVKVTYQDEYNNTYNETCTINLSVYDNITYLSETTLSKVVSELSNLKNEIRNTIHKRQNFPLLMRIGSLEIRQPPLQRILLALNSINVTGQSLDSEINTELKKMKEGDFEEIYCSNLYGDIYSGVYEIKKIELKEEDLDQKTIYYFNLYLGFHKPNTPSKS